MERQAADRLISVGDPAAGLSTDHVSCPDQIKHQMSSIALSVKRCLQHYLQKTVVHAETSGVTFSQYICHIAKFSSIRSANIVCGYTASMDNNLQTTTPSSKNKCQSEWAHTFWAPVFVSVHSTIVKSCSEATCSQLDLVFALIAVILLCVLVNCTAMFCCAATRC